MTATLIILLLTVGMFVWGRVRSDIVALSALTALLLLGILTPAEAFAGFSSSIVIMMIGLFVVGGAIMQTGLAKLTGNKLMALAKGNETATFLLVMIVTSFIGAFVSNTGTVALLLPIVLAMAKTAGTSPSKLMMPLAFASSMGGILTLIGTPPNLIVDGYLRDNGLPGFAFFDFLPIGLICLGTGLLLLYPLCRLFMSKKGKDADADAAQESNPDRLLHEYHIDSLVFRLEAPGGSHRLDGLTVGELDIRRHYGVTILEVRRANRTVFSTSIQEPVNAATVLRANDTFYVLGPRHRVTRFARDHGLNVHVDGEADGKAKLDFYEIGLAEVLITPGSALVNRPLRASNFKERFGVSVLAVKRQGSYIFHHLLDSDVKNGDMLLVHGPWKGIESMSKKNREWIVIGRPEEDAGSVPLDHKAPLAAVIMTLMVVCMVFADHIGVKPVATVIIAGLLMVLTRCVRSVDAAYKMIGWESIVLIAAMMPMSTALSKTGISAWTATTIVENLHAYGPIAALAGVYVVTSILSTFISNSATAILVAPIAWAAATQLGVSPAPFMMTAAVAASACFATPICTPPNAMVMNAGHYTFMDYVRVGLPLQIIMAIVAIAAIPLFFPF